ncbi:GNAT family N-acetyltransferase [Phreatobacter stygius]|uniref:GNAT family N-acetyltransferase n=1 Tax=Phreatobacter stygius TaxID=1940610 RepID=A0A4D7ASH7_9HYPH|nr:GNAT family N-acetyltransferase [Phreatobacter stygius]QCI63919.1 GNAT family N-acetyltransferase [Phreatobacter stygius]
MTIDNRTAMSRVSACLRATMNCGSNVFRLSPFTVMVDEASADPFRSYAIPDDGAEPNADGIAALVALFAAKDRTPRLEYIPDLAPAVLPCLETAGFRVERYLPLMTCSPTSLLPPPDLAGVDWLIVDDVADLAAAARVQNEAYGLVETLAADVERLRHVVAKGGAVALARAAGDGEPLGSGLYSPPHGGVAEIAAIGVRPAARRRGIGGGVTALLARRAMDKGVAFPFLMAAEDDDAWRTYQRIGFTDCGTMLHISR